MPSAAHDLGRFCRFRDDNNDVYSQWGDECEMKTWIIRNREMIAAILCGVLLLLGYVLGDQVSSVGSAIIYSVAFLIGGFAKAKEGIETFVKEKELDVNVLMILAAVGAASIGYWLEGAMLIFIFSLSGALESYTLAKSEKDLSNLISLQPDLATRLLEDGTEEKVSIEQLQVGEKVVIRPGERIPVDGWILEGSSMIDQSTITGESIPVEKSIDVEVYAGTLNGNGALVVQVTKESQDSLFAKILHLLEQAKEQVPARQQWIERFEKIYVQVVLLVTGFLLFIPHFAWGWSWDETMYRAMVFLVVASPCAVMASIMPALLSAMSYGARKGVLFKTGVQLEQLADVKVIAFDKTGTLTNGTPKVTDWKVWGDLSEEEFFQAIGSIEMRSEHPIAHAIVEAANLRNVSFSSPDGLQAITGFGVKATLLNHVWQLGKPSMFADLSSHMNQEVLQREAEGKTVVLVARDQEIIGMVAMLDTIRRETIYAIQQLKQLGIRVAMLTGDQAETARTIAQEAGIDLVYSNLLPDEKVKKIQELQSQFGDVAMTGDGVNDAPALATAQVGIAMGGRGSDVALETADVVLMNDDLTHVSEAIRLGRKLQVIVKQNLIFALAVIGLLLIANFTQSITLPLGVVGHEGSTILVILNGLRLLQNKW